MTRERRLLLIAMSGVRIRNESLAALGVTLPGFVERSQVIASLPSLGLLTLAGYSPPNWRVEYLEIDQDSDSSVEGIVSERYDLVAISSLSARILETYRLADRLRSEGIRVVLGGLHVSALPHEAAQHADAVVVGGGEGIWERLLGDFEENRLNPLYRSPPTDSTGFTPETHRIPRFDLLDPKRYNRLTIQTTRGCPLDCTFCGASPLISQYKKKPIALIRRELEAILSIWPKPFIELADDNTFVDKRWSGELADLFREHSIRWFTETDSSISDDEELLHSLAESGCVQLLIGFESVQSESLEGIDSRNWKLSRSDSFPRSVEKIQSCGISVNGCFILGHDGDVVETFARTRDAVFASPLSEVQVTVLTPFPGTLLHRKLESQKRLLRDVYWDQCTLFDVTFRPALMAANDLEEGFHDLMRDVYSDERVAERKSRFRRILFGGEA